MSPKPLIDMTVLLENIYYPLMHNPQNQATWPEIIKKDVELQVQELRNAISEVCFTSHKLPSIFLILDLGTPCESWTILENLDIFLYQI